MQVFEIRKLTGLSQETFGKKYGIPKRTIQNWENDVREVPQYVCDLLENQVKRDYAKSNRVVMTAIARQMEFYHSKVLTNPINKGKDMSSIVVEVNKLYDAYMELRGHTGSVINIAGVDQEVNNVKSIYELVNNK